MRASALFGVGVISALATSACHGDRSQATTSAPDAAPSAAPISSLLLAMKEAGAGVSRVHRPPLARKIGCRAVSVGGVATVRDGDAGARAIAPSAEIPLDTWVDLAEGAKLTAKDPHTTRETTFLGAAHLRACVEGEELAYLTRGTFTSTLGSGESPGHEEWIVTPLGVVKYASGVIRVTVTRGKLEVAVTTGSAQVWPVDGAKLVTKSDAARSTAGWTRFDAGSAVIVTKDPAKDAADRTAAACKAVSAEAHALALQLVAPDASLADLAPRQTDAVVRARAACEVALLENADSSANPVAERQGRDVLQAALDSARSTQ